MTNHVIGDSDNPFEYVNRPEVKENDTIEVVTSNQQGYKKYKVILDENNIKDLDVIADWESNMYGPNSGGRRRRTRRRRRSSRRRTHRKSKRTMRRKK